MNMHESLGSTMRDDAAATPALWQARRTRLCLIVAGAALILAIAALVWSRRDTAPPPAPVLPRVSVLVPGLQLVAAEVRATGSIEAKRAMPAAVQGEGGAVVAVLAEAGQKVGKGQLLARLDSSVQSQQVRQLEAALQQARADAALADSELRRAQTLVEKGFISKADIERRTATRDSAQARVAVAAAQLREGRARLARLEIRAPGAGLVLSRAVEPGQVVGAGSPPLFVVAEKGVMEMRAAIAEQDMPGLKIGQKAQVTIIGSPRQFTGKVWLVEPAINADSRQGRARILLDPDPDLRPGAFANARIATGETQRPLLPQSAVMIDDAGSYVLVVDSADKVQRRSVTLGATTAKGLVIEAGLTGKERVVMSAGAFLRKGEKIHPVRVQG